MTLRRLLVCLSLGCATVSVAAAILLPVEESAELRDPMPAAATATTDPVDAKSFAPNREASLDRSPFQLKAEIKLVPISQPTPPPPNSQIQVPGFRVIGIIFNSETPAIVVEDTKTHAVTRLHLADHMDGWRIDRIADRSAFVSVGEKMVELRLDPNTPH